MATPWEEYKKKLGVTRPWDVLSPKTEYAESDLARKRLETCLGCEKLIQLTKQCSECLCFMQYKTKLAEAECPLHKW